MAITDYQDIRYDARPDVEVLWEGGWWFGVLAARRRRDDVWEGFVRFSERTGDFPATRNGWFVYETELRLA